MNAHGYMAMVRRFEASYREYIAQLEREPLQSDDDMDDEEAEDAVAPEPMVDGGQAMARAPPVLQHIQHLDVIDVDMEPVAPEHEEGSRERPIFVDENTEVYEDIEIEIELSD